MQPDTIARSKSRPEINFRANSLSPLKWTECVLQSMTWTLAISGDLNRWRLTRRFYATIASVSDSSLTLKYQ